MTISFLSLAALIVGGWVYVFLGSLYFGEWHMVSEVFFFSYMIGAAYIGIRLGWLKPSNKHSIDRINNDATTPRFAKVS